MVNSGGEGDGGYGYGGSINMEGSYGFMTLNLADGNEPGYGGASFWGSGGYGDSPSAKSYGAGGCGADYSGGTQESGSGYGGVVVIEYY